MSSSVTYRPYRDFEEVETQLLVEAWHVEDGPALLDLSVHHTVVEREPDGHRFSGCLEPEPWGHVARMEIAESPAVVALAAEDPGLDVPLLEGSVERLENVPAVLFDASRDSDASRSVEGEVGVYYGIEFFSDPLAPSVVPMLPLIALAMHGDLHYRSEE